MICQVEKKKIANFFQKKQKKLFFLMIQRGNLVSDGNVANING